MRELEFLPPWYPRIRRRKRMVIIQTWGTLALLAALGAWILLAQRTVHARQTDLKMLGSDLSQSETDLQRLEALQGVQRDLGRQMEISRKIGTPVRTTRVITTLEQIMPREMSLLDLTVDSQDASAHSSSRTLAARASHRAGAADAMPQSQLRFTLHGVAPTDMDLAEFLAKLTSKPFFRNVELMFSRERSDRGHIMREFEVAFVMDLSSLGAR